MKLKKLTALVLASMMIASTATAVPVSAAEDNEYMESTIWQIT